MAGNVRLSHPAAVQHGGLLYVVGQRDGQYWIRRSADGGKTWLPYSDGSLEKAIAPASCEQRAGIVKLASQGAPLVACIPTWPDLLLYLSFDDGETWRLEGAV